MTRHHPGALPDAIRERHPDVEWRQIRTFVSYSGLSCSVVAAAVSVTIEPASARPYLLR